VLDLNSGYILILLFSFVMSLLNGAILSKARDYAFFLSWTLASFLWVIVLGGVLFQKVHLLTSQILVSGAMSLYLFFVIRASFETEKKVMPAPEIWRVTIFTFFSTNVFLHVTDMPRIWSFLLISFITSFIYFYASTVFFSYYRNNTRGSSVGKSYMILSSAFAISSLLWLTRLFLALRLPKGAGLYAHHSVNTVTLLLIPPAAVFLNMAMILLYLNKKNAESQAFYKQFLRKEGELILNNQLINTNHEINTPLGTAKLALSFFHQEEKSEPEEMAFYQEISHQLEEINQIMEDRKVLLNREIKEKSLISSREMIEVFNRVLSHTPDGEKVHLHLESPNLQEHLPIKFFFTIVFLIGKVVQKTQKEREPCLFLRLTQTESAIYLDIRYEGSLFKDKDPYQINESMINNLEEYFPPNRAVQITWLLSFLQVHREEDFTLKQSDQITTFSLRLNKGKQEE